MILWPRVKEEEERARSRTATRKRVSMERVCMCEEKISLVGHHYILKLNAGKIRKRRVGCREFIGSSDYFI